MPRYSTCHRDMLGRVMGRLDAVIALVESLPDKCAKQYWRARVTPVALEWHILAADAGL
ncbi:MAG: hypothetical protein HY719_13710, partial [Planctomycetes bacterium]|nr:hypothetical protein [Planctomycetota bacterium]